MYKKFFLLFTLFAAIRNIRSYSVFDNEQCENYKNLQKRAIKTSYVLQKADVIENPNVQEYQSTIADPNFVNVDDELAIQVIGREDTKMVQQQQQQHQQKFVWNHDQDTSKFMNQPLIIRSRFNEDGLNHNVESRMFDTTINENSLDDYLRNLEEISNVPLSESEGDGSKLFYVELDEMISGNKKDNAIKRDKTVENVKKAEDLMEIVTVETVQDLLNVQDENITNHERNFKKIVDLVNKAKPKEIYKCEKIVEEN